MIASPKPPSEIHTEFENHKLKFKHKFIPSFARGGKNPNSIQQGNWERKRVGKVEPRVRRKLIFVLFRLSYLW